MLLARHGHVRDSHQDLGMAATLVTAIGMRVMELQAQQG